MQRKYTPTRGVDDALGSRVLYPFDLSTSCVKAHDLRTRARRQVTNLSVKAS